jgi:hypothetical protein
MLRPSLDGFKPLRWGLGNLSQDGFSLVTKTGALLQTCNNTIVHYHPHTEVKKSTTEPTRAGESRPVNKELIKSG